MISSNPIPGTALHTIGGVSAATCYRPDTKIRNWSWGTFWLVQSLFISPLMEATSEYRSLRTVIKKS